jgi:hypothetical protein
MWEYLGGYFINAILISLIIVGRHFENSIFSWIFGEILKMIQLHESKKVESYFRSRAWELLNLKMKGNLINPYANSQVIFNERFSSCGK